MIKNGKLWLLFYYDESDPEKTHNFGLFDTLQEAMDCVRFHARYAPFVKHYKLATIDVTDCLSILYDDNKILLS